MSASARSTTLVTLDEIAERLERALRNSPADETEIVWLEFHRGYCRRQRSRVDSQSSPSRTVLVRVLDLGRVGSYRGGGDYVALDDPIRLAIAQSRAREPLPGLQHLPADNAAPAVTEGLYDPELAALDEKRAAALLRDLPLKQENAHLSWSEGRVAVFNSRGIRRSTQVTAASLEIRTGRRPGAARARDASRKLGSLEPMALLEEARSRHAPGKAAPPPTGPTPVVFSSLAVIELCDLLGSTSFSAKAYYDGTSFLREHLNIQVFDRRINLRDDATDQRAIPFPFDMEGTAKRPIDLIAQGAPRTPTLDQRQAAVLGLPPTAHAIGGNNARAENLLLLPGEDSDDDLLRAADGGIWIGWLDALESLDPTRVRFRARAHGIRQIVDGQLGSPVGDMVVEDGLLRAFSAILGVGNRMTSRLGPDGVVGGISAPAVAVVGVAF
jgi:predicted Zn-dependent protease